MVFSLGLVTVDRSRAADFDLAASAINELAVDLHRQLATNDDNLCVSPYSIQNALAMASAGADGDTRSEMSRVLHLPDEGNAIHASFASLHRALSEIAAKTTQSAKQSGGPREPIILAVANRLFAQSGYDFRDSFRALVRKFYDAPLEPVDFKKNPERERQRINEWVAKQTRDRIRNLIPAGGVTEATRLVLTNAIYLKAPWASQFSEGATKPRPFRVRGKTVVDVPMMNERKNLGYAKHDGFTVVGVPYTGGELQFVVILPDKNDGLHALEQQVNAGMLAQCAKLEDHDVDLSMPKFKFEPPTIALAATLKALGMHSAFDEPAGSANFGRIAPRKPNGYLYLSQVFHKTFISVDEKGTEAAAATAAAMVAGAQRQDPRRRHRSL